MVNTSLKKLKYHLAGFDVVVKERTTPTTITEGSWGFEHTKACFRDEIIPFVKALKDLFNTFNQYLVDELSEVQNVFHQMEQAVEQHRLESKTFKVKMNQVLNENERLLEQVLSKDIVNIIVNCCEMCMNVKRCLKFATEALKNDLRKLKGKDLADNVVTKHTSDPELLRIEYGTNNPKTYQTLDSACRITTTTEVPLRKPTALENETPKPVVTLVYSRKPRKSKTNVPDSKSKVVVFQLFSVLGSGCSKHMTGDRSQLTNFVNKFLGTVKFGNDHVAKILGYGDYQIGNVTISRVYYVEGLGHNLFSVGQFCDSNLEVAFRQHTCFIRNLEGVDLLTGSRGNNLYTLSLGDMMTSSPICLLLKASKTKS
ncbi:hypothetical protein Tco_0441719 [Tanacetum coccineum]